MRAFRHPVYAAVLAVAWLVLQGRVTAGDFVVGYAVATIVVWLCRDFWSERVTVRQPLVMLRLAATFLRELLRANLQVAWILLQPRLRIQPAFIVIPLELRDDLAITALASMITLTPGTLTVDVAPDRSALWVHCLSATDADAVRAQIKQQFEQPLVEGIECSPL
ncbi:MAG TPA: Na+/H+ antiporter subunit E [Candidatus Binatia bacterium]|nr:Na+/H+ antiporter subunit E [Candidatus Binatia bacterium]